MNEMANLFLALTTGMVLGAIFFGGLWLTIRHGLLSKWPTLVFLGSLLLRTAIALAGFFIVSRGDWRRLLASLVGFFVSRLLVSRFTSTPVDREAGVVGGGET